MIFIFAAIVIALCLFSVFRKVGFEPFFVKSYPISSGWDISIKSDKVQDISPEKIETGIFFDRGDIITIKNHLPVETPPHAGLRIYTNDAVVNVKVRGQKIYEYGREAFAEGKTVGSGYHFVNLPADAAGQYIVITITCAESFRSSALPEVELTSGIDMFRKFVAENASVIFINLFLLLLGVVLFIVSIAFVSVNKEYLELTGMGLFSIVAAIWGLCSRHVPQIIGISVTANSIMEFIFLYSTPVVFLVLLLFSRRELSRIKKLALHIILVISIVFFAASILFLITNVMHLPRIRRIYDILMVFVGGFSIFVTKTPKQRRTTGDLLFEISLIVIFVTGVYEMFRKDVSAIYRDIPLLRLDFFSAGILFFVVGMIASYLIGIYRRALGEQEVLVLKSLASIDSMTGLSNRKKANSVLSELDRSEDPYVILSFDINGLKKVNDKFGHETGDRLILSFAKLLKECIGPYAELFRMGGDEFVAVATKDNIASIGPAMRKLVSMEKLASEGEIFTIDASFGASVSTELEKPMSEEILKLSDSRMYEMKKRSGKGRLS